MQLLLVLKKKVGLLSSCVSETGILERPILGLSAEDWGDVAAALVRRRSRLYHLELWRSMEVVYDSVSLLKTSGRRRMRSDTSLYSEMAKRGIDGEERVLSPCDEVWRPR